MKEHKTLLIVEDDADDRQLMLDTIKQINPLLNLVFTQNGLQALDYLDKIKEDPSKMPCLIVLDLNMPYVDGKETYQRIRDNSSLSGVPVIIFTSSLNPNDKALFEKSGVEFFSKPDHYSEMNRIVSHMLQVCTQVHART
jgi:CheY-like chemotaxis protein